MENQSKKKPLKKAPATKAEPVSSGASFFGRHRRAIVLFVAFVLPILLFLTVLITQGFYPFGSKTTIFMDLKDQYMEFLSSLRYVGESDHSLLYSWSRSMGGNALGLYAYYSGGLLSFITCLFPVSMIYAGVLFLQVVEIGLCGLSFAVFLEFGPREKRGDPRTILFATAYALMSYNMVYTACFMWLTGCIFLPLCMLGIEKILAGKRGLLFYLSLSAAMICNYYTAYMICLFSVLYFVFRVIGQYDFKKENRMVSLKQAGVSALRYGGCGIAAAMTALPVLLPVYTDLMSGKLSAAGSEVAGTNFDFFDVFKKLLPGQYDSITNEGALPSLYTGLICLLLVLFMFFCKRIKPAERIAGVCILFLLLFCFWQKIPDCFWHGMQVPNWFPYRYAFVFGFFMVYLASRSFDGWAPEFPKARTRNIITVCLIAMLSLELCINAKTCINSLGDQFGYMETSEYDTFVDKTEPLVRDIKENDSSLYRVAKDYEFSKNDAMLFGYNGMTHYSSTYNADVNRVTPCLGLAQSWMWNSGYGGSPFVDSLFGVKYRLNSRVPESGMPDNYQKTDESEDVTLFTNTYALPFVFTADESCRKLGALNEDVFSNQNTVMNRLTGLDSYLFSFYGFDRTDAPGETHLSFTAVNGDPVYLYIQQENGWWGEIYVNDRFVSNYFSTETTCAVYLGEFMPDEKVTVSVRSDNATFSNAWIAAMNMDACKESLKKLQAGNFTEQSHGAGSLSGEIHVTDGQVIATSIPYDEGYTIKIDGEKTEYDKWLDTFIAVPASPGTHTIEISYTPVGFTTGLIAAIAAIILMTAYLTFPKWKGVFKKNNP